MDNIACAVDRNVCSNWTFLFAPHGHELRNLNNPTPPDFVAATESSILFVWGRWCWKPHWVLVDRPGKANSQFRNS